MKAVTDTRLVKIKRMPRFCMNRGNEPFNWKEYVKLNKCVQDIICSERLAKSNQGKADKKTL